jgi:transcriptional regulator GlxA family with amidase domain
MTPMAAPIQVAFVLMPDSLILDWAGPAEALRIANQCLRATGQPEAFALRFIGPESQTSSSVGAIISQIEPLPPDLSEPAWVVLVGQPGRTVDADSDSARQLIRWLRALELAPGCWMATGPPPTTSTSTNCAPWRPAARRCRTACSWSMAQ